jgi:Mce-associated membrane protein
MVASRYSLSNGPTTGCVSTKSSFVQYHPTATSPPDEEEISVCKTRAAASRRRHCAQAQVISCLSVHDPDGPDAEDCGDPADVTDAAEPQSRSGVNSGAVAPVSTTGAEDEVAEAEARAEAARARVAQLRREVGDADDDAAQSSRKRRWMSWRPKRPQWLHRPGRKAIAVGIGIVLTFASLGATGYMLWQHRAALHKRQLTAEFTEAARQGITTLMTIDPDHARDSVQRMIDASTGDQKNMLSALSVLIVKKAEDTKVGSKVNVEAVAVESVSDDSGVVLVAARTDAIGPDNAKPPPALFRASVTMDRDGGQLKISKVEFLK